MLAAATYYCARGMSSPSFCKVCKVFKFSTFFATQVIEALPRV